MGLKTMSANAVEPMVDAKAFMLNPPTEEELQELKHHTYDLSPAAGRVEGGTKAILRPPNVTEETTDGICAAINGGHGSLSHAARPFCVGRLIPAGHIGLTLHNGRIEASPPGRYRFFFKFQRASWAGNCNVQFKNPVEIQNLTVIRVPRGQIGVATEGGTAVFLDAGLHIYNKPEFKFKMMGDVNAATLSYGTIHIVRVPRGQYAKVWVASANGALEPKLLREGCHVLDSSIFNFAGHIDVAKEHIQHKLCALRHGEFV
eukprot:NODE_18915_length_868_cov_10.237517.p1 GENE.NODE_18915_length_868_cov_10.237517~~NODE_18915_length_868_cov_10.237517.p1  ORF type:complete len:260 (+),score=56.23 NODE_18915_length_868_cov_10.237517:2-781(+)